MTPSQARETSSPGHLERKLSFCQELLALYTLVMPGLTRERGLAMYELYITLRSGSNSEK